jgi:heat-inducible transcriptional repressor
MASRVASPELTFRARKILYAVISEYIGTGEPVGSRRLARRYGLNLSPATIRNVLADLTDAGYLTQPHTSAGRVPTDLGFRLFVDALAQMRRLAAEDQEVVVERFKGLRPGVDDVMREAGRLLAAMSGAAAVVTRPRADTAKLAHIRFVPLSGDQLLAVVVTQQGAVQNRVVAAPRPIPRDEIERLHNLLAELVTGRTLPEVRDALAAQMESEEGQVQHLRRLAEAMLAAAADGADAPGEIVIEGQHVLFGRPEFVDADKIRLYLRTFEEKQRLLDLLDQTLVAGGIQVLIGEEAELDHLVDVSLISANYERGGVQAGTVGIIGPTRMDYPKLVPLVGFTARVMGEMLDGHLGQESLEDE